ncbi:MAG: 5-formyltetrahydrofolate cyclo-ligase [Thermofilaceae archaeon]
MSVARLKADLREETWRRLDEHRVVTPRPSRGRIPIFSGSRVAAMKVSRRDFFREAEVVYASADPSLQPLREEVLRAGKLLVMMVPIFRGFAILNGRSVPQRAVQAAATPRGAVTQGNRVRVLDNVSVDLVVFGSVAVDRRGGRLGKGDGQHDLEYAVLRELGAINESTPVVTLVHDLQLVERVPMELHDAPVDYIATPSQLIRAEGGLKRPRGVIWDLIDSATAERLPLLKLLAGLG